MSTPGTASGSVPPTSSGPKRLGFFTYIVPALLYVLVIFYSGLRPPPHGLPTVKYTDKVLHAIAFGFMVIVLRRAIAFQAPRLSLRKVLAVSVVVAAVVGGGLEIAQSFTATRSPELLDFVADVFGAVVVAAAIDRIHRRDRR